MATIGLSLSSSMFQELGPDARELLEVVAFFPQDVNEKNIHWLFRAVPNVLIMLDKLCALSLTSDQRIVTVLATARSPAPQGSEIIFTQYDQGTLLHAVVRSYLSPAGPISRKHDGSYRRTSKPSIFSVSSQPLIPTQKVFGIHVLDTWIACIGINHDLSH